MSIKFEHGGKVFEAGTPEQVVRLLDLLERREAFAAKREAYSQALLRTLDSRKGDLVSAQPARFWTADLFEQFTGRLSATQERALAMMLAFRSGVPDEALRSALGTTTNQALAGVLSGISKQAQAIGIPRRAVFTSFNSRSRGKRSNTYCVEDEFRETASELSWHTPKVSEPYA